MHFPLSDERLDGSPDRLPSWTSAHSSVGFEPCIWAYAVCRVSSSMNFVASQSQASPHGPGGRARGKFCSVLLHTIRRDPSLGSGGQAESETLFRVVTHGHLYAPRVRGWITLSRAVRARSFAASQPTGDPSRSGRRTGCIRTGDESCTRPCGSKRNRGGWPSDDPPIATRSSPYQFVVGDPKRLQPYIARSGVTVAGTPGRSSPRLIFRLAPANTARRHVVLRHRPWCGTINPPSDPSCLERRIETSAQSATDLSTKEA